MAQPKLAAVRKYAHPLADISAGLYVALDRPCLSLREAGYARTGKSFGCKGSTSIFFPLTFWLIFLILMYEVLPQRKDQVSGFALGQWESRKHHGPRV